MTPSVKDALIKMFGDGTEPTDQNYQTLVAVGSRASCGDMLRILSIYTSTWQCITLQL